MPVHTTSSSHFLLFRFPIDTRRSHLRNLTSNLLPQYPFPMRTIGSVSPSSSGASTASNST